MLRGGKTLSRSREAVKLLRFRLSPPIIPRMQAIVLDKPYRFVPPHPGGIVTSFMLAILPRFLRRSWGITSWEVRGIEHLKQSMEASHGILLATTHGRPCDPFLLGLISRMVGKHPYLMASRHLFELSPLKTWLLRQSGAFSVFREGVDRESLKAGIQILVEGKRPLAIFPEGIVTRTNDRLGTLLEGTAFMARSAAKQRARLTPPGQVVIHPVAIKHYFLGDLQATAGPVLDELEARFSWQPQRHRSILERVVRLAEAMLTLKEIAYFGMAQSGSTQERLSNLIERVLHPLEEEWLPGRRPSTVIERVKQLRTAILPDMIAGTISDAERTRRWSQLADIYLAQQLICYPPDYLSERRTVERVLETLERIEEDLTDEARIHRPFRVVVQVGEAIPVGVGRDRGGIEDALMQELAQQLQAMLTNLSSQSTPLSHSVAPALSSVPSPSP